MATEHLFQRELYENVDIYLIQKVKDLWKDMRLMLKIWHQEMW